VRSGCRERGHVRLAGGLARVEGARMGVFMRDFRTGSAEQPPDAVDPREKK